MIERIFMAALCWLLAWLLDSRYHGPIDWPLTGVIRLFWPEHREKYNKKYHDKPDPLASAIRVGLVVVGLAIVVV